MNCSPDNETQQPDILGGINGIQLISSCICTASVSKAAVWNKRSPVLFLIWSPWKLCASRSQAATKTPEKSRQRLFAHTHTHTERIVIEKVIKRGGPRRQAPDRFSLGNLRSPECETQIIRLHAGDSYCCLRLCNKRAVGGCNSSSFKVSLGTRRRSKSDHGPIRSLHPQERNSLGAPAF